MEEQLKTLKRSMEHTVFKNISYDREESIHKVLNGVKQKDKSSPKVTKLQLVGKHFPRLLGIATCFGLIFFTLQIANLTPDKLFKEKAESVHPKSNVQSHKQYNPIKDPGPLSKKELLFRMMNTMDYFSSAQGSYTIQQFGNQTTIIYGIAMNGDKYKSYSISVDGKNDKQLVYSSDHQDVFIFPEIKGYKKREAAVPFKKGKPIQLNEVITNTDDGSAPTFKSRPRPITDATHSLFNWELVQSYLIVNHNWEIVSQNDEMFGYKTIIVKGSIRKKLPNDKYITSFKLWINRPTGILVKWESYDSQGNVIDSLNTSSLKLNKEIDNSLFKVKIPSDYKKMTLR